MSIRLVQLVFKSRIKILPSEKLVLLCLANFANDKNDLLCCPSVNLIAQTCNLSKEQTKRILRILAKFKIINKIIRKDEKNNHNSNLYEINEAALIHGGVGSSTTLPRVIHDPTLGSPTTPNNISNNTNNKKENNIKESPPSVAEHHPSFVLRSTAKLVLSFLKEKSGREYREVDSNIRPIISLLKEGITLEQLKQVIARKEKEWGNNKEMQKHLCVKTLFRKSNFYGKYLPELVTTEEMKKFMKKD